MRFALSAMAVMNAWMSQRDNSNERHRSKPCERFGFTEFAFNLVPFRSTLLVLL